MLYNVVRGSNTDSDKGHCVLIDFSNARFSVDFTYYMCTNWGECLSLLLDDRVGMDPALVWDAYGLQEPWDLVGIVKKFNGEYRETEGPDPLATESSILVQYVNSSFKPVGLPIPRGAILVVSLLTNLEGHADETDPVVILHISHHKAHL